MSNRSIAVRSGDVSAVRRQFKEWRRSRRHGDRIPEPLWRAAVALAQRLGISKTSLALHLDYYALKKRVEPGPRRPAGGDGAGARFVEIPLRAVAGSAACVLEVEDGRGARLRVELQEIDTVELPVLVRSIWNQPQ